MTEQEWLACNDPHPMLEFLGRKASDRKLRLFAVGCCRAIWTLLAEKSQECSPDSQPILLDHEKRIVQAVEPFLEVAEQYADGQAGSNGIGTAYSTLLGTLSMRRPRQEPWAFALVALLRAVSTGGRFYGQEWEYQHHDAIQCAKDAADYVAQVAGWIGKTDADHEAMQEPEATLLRCIFGPLLFRLMPFNPHRLTVTVLKLGQSIYDERAFDRLPLLADALEDVGYHNADILNHCRNGGPHVRGCWVVDLLLGKK